MTENTSDLPGGYSKGFSLKIALEKRAEDILTKFGGDVKLLTSADKLRESLSSFQTGLFKNNGDLGKIVQGFQKSFVDGVSSLNNVFLQKFGSLISDAVEELDVLLDSSQLSSKGTRNLAFQYGFNASEAYAWQKALGAVGLESEEDLWYASDLEQDEFARAFTHFSQQYTELYDQGFFDSLQEYQFEMAAFEEQMKLSIAQFFIDNKDLIQSALKGILAIASKVANFMSLFHESDHQIKVSEAIGNTSYSTKNTNVTIDNTFNGVQSTDRAELTQAGNQTFMQIITALKGGSV